VLGIDPKDIKSIQWYQMLGEISVLLDAQLDENKKIQEDLRRREERYNKREQDYRQKIDDLQRELRVRLGYEKDADKKNRRIYKKMQGEIDQQIASIDTRVNKLKDEQEKDIIRKFNSLLAKIKKGGEEKKNSNGESGAELKERENELQHHLELITNIAQRIDNENRALLKKNQELRNEYKAQENDRELLVRQLVQHKKENGKIKEQIELYQRLTQQRQDEEGIEEPLDVDGFEEDLAKKRAQLGTRGSSTRGGQANQQQQANPLVYIPKQKTETEDEKVLRYERVIDKLKKMLEHERRLLKGARQQYQREMGVKTELEVLLRETVEQVIAEKQKANSKRMTSKVSGGARFMMAGGSSTSAHITGIAGGMPMGAHAGSTAEDWLAEINS
jgi:DNA repair exonuclease SbcCD ATPase subunit